jgi:hypothetical protein
MEQRNVRLTPGFEDIVGWRKKEMDVHGTIP